ncbi:OmpL47-type beta-barrel domain-containing protein (plasmid) [Paenibacillus polymyxa]|uniref:OmpL47-type beta-barrel domain-containing protein n=1 Tax=Paenibacillus polymyxa TaxID=1406 RepID=UPI003B5BE659
MRFKHKWISGMLVILLMASFVPIFPHKAAAASYFVGQEWTVTNISSSYTLDLGEPGLDRNDFGLDGRYFIYTPRNNGEYTRIDEYFSDDGSNWYKLGNGIVFRNDYESGSSSGPIQMSTQAYPNINRIRYYRLVSNKPTTIFEKINIYVTAGPYATDKTPPTKPTIELTPNGVTRGNVQVTITGSTDDKLLRGYEYKLEGATQQDWTAGDHLSITNEGNTMIHARAVDYNYNRSSEVIALASIDRSPPGAPTLTPSRTGYVNTDVAVTVQHGADTGGGIRGSQFKLTGALNQDWSNYTGPVSIQNHGITTLTARTVDNDGRMGAESSISVSIDKVAPTAPTINPAGSHGNGYNVTLQPGNDDLSGLAHTQYRISGAISQDWTEYNGSFPVQVDGKSTVYARSIDQAGNVSSEAKSELTIDKKGPTAPIINPDNIGPTANDIKVSLEPGTDPVYGVKLTQYRLSHAAEWLPYTGPFMVTTEGIHELAARTINNLDVSSPVVTKSVTIDRTKPTVPEITVSEVTAPTKYTNKPVHFKITGGTDTTEIHYEYQMNSGSYQIGASGTINDSGITKITAQAVDAAGNRSEPVSVTSYIDMEAPKIEMTPDSRDWGDAPINVELSYKDQHAGVDPATMKYQVTNSSDTPVVWDTADHSVMHLRITDEGEWYVHAKVSDRAGNTFVTTSQVMRIQNQPQPVTLSVLSVKNSEAELEWTLPSGLTDGYSYTVRNLTTGAMWDVSHPTNTFKDTGLEGGHTYEYEVQSINHVGNNAYSNRVSVLTLPNAPENILINTVSRTPARITADITPVFSADQYNIAATDVETGQVIFNDTVTQDVYNPITGLEPGKLYDISASAVNASGEGAMKHVSFLSLPDTPGGFREATVYEDGVHLKWNTVSTATYYELDRDQASVYRDVYTEYKDMGLRSGTEYSYAVSAENETGLGDYSRLGIITLPAQVTTLTRVSSDVYSVGVRWEDVEGAEGYLLNVNDDSDIRLPRGSNQYTFEGLQPGTPVKIKIRGFNRSGIGKDNTISALTAPESVVLSESTDIGEHSATLVWQPVHGATIYEVKVDGQVYYSTETKLKVTGLSGGTSYDFSVSSGNSGGFSPPTMGKLLTIPPQVQNVQVTEIGNGQIKLSWDETQSANHYLVTRRDKDQQLETNTNSFILSDIQPGVIYGFGVQAANDSGIGETTPFTYRALPGMIANGTLILKSVTDTGMKASWTETTGADSYNIYRDDVFVGNTTNLEYGLDKLGSSTVYKISVAPVNTTGEAKKTLEDEETLPSPDFFITKKDTTRHDFDIQWKSDHKNDIFVLTGEKDEELYRGKGRGFTWTGLKEGRTYSANLWAENSQGKRTEIKTVTEKTSSKSEMIENDVVSPVTLDETPKEILPIEDKPVVENKKKHFDDIELTFNRDKINDLADMGILKGTTDTTFEPNRPVTRAEYTSMLVRALDLKSQPSVNLTFKDIDESAWYIDPLKTAIKDEVARGFSKTVFAPDRIINREQAAKMTNNVVRSAPMQEVNVYSDSSKIVQWAREDVLGLTEYNLVQGYPDGSFRPKQDITRAEAAEIVYNMLKKSK